jgi:wyosine [tRNA(Phe)-imidazoG37] synthetase (radical SAM superfamily)
MSGIPLQSGIIYGPVFSRRLGRSLGINLLPMTRKRCSFNCIYCEYGPDVQYNLLAESEEFPEVLDIVRAVEKALLKPRTIECLTFSGNGEPTMHPAFYEIIREVKALRDRIRPDTRIAVLSNASRINHSDVLRALKLVNAPMLKLDAGDEEIFQSINRPKGALKLADILEGMSEINPLFIQSVLFDGEISNVTGSAYENWAAAVGRLRPALVQIYSTERPTAEKGVKCVSPQRLEEIAQDLRQRYGIRVESFSRAE